MRHATRAFQKKIELYAGCLQRTRKGVNTERPSILSTLRVLYPPLDRIPDIIYNDFWEMSRLAAAVNAGADYDRVPGTVVKALVGVCAEYVALGII